MSRKIFATTVIATVILMLTTALLPVVVTAAPEDPADWYITVEGVLDSDTYVLYPYAKKSLKIGISKFGELIDANTKTGLEYGGVIDPFAADPEVVPEFEWSQGWVINITYAYSGWYRNVWAFALYSDSFDTSSIGGDWKRADRADSTTVLGGRKYGGKGLSDAGWIDIGYVETEPLKVLYNGPRKFIALSRTIIYEDEGKEFPLVRLDLTFIFNKVKKYVIVLKDIKRLDDRKFSSGFQIEFSNRGEWDLGLEETPGSYVHIFEGLDTVYDGEWHTFYDNTKEIDYDVAQIISTEPWGYVGFAAFWPQPLSKYVEDTSYLSRKTMLTTISTHVAEFIGDGSSRDFTITPPENPSPVEYPRGDGHWSDAPMVFLDGMLQAPDSDYTWDSSTDTVHFTSPPHAGAKIWIVYKTEVKQLDMSVEPTIASGLTPGTPYVIAEWDFDLNEKGDQFRAVTVYGVTDRHDASDDNMGPAYGDLLDREVRYLLDEVFNPIDLNDAVHKQTKRWVEFKVADLDGTITLDHRPFYDVGVDRWDQYCSFSERVIDLSVSPPKVLNRTKGEYDVSVDAKGYATITGLIPGHLYKILYSTLPQVSGEVELTTELFDSFENMMVCDTKSFDPEDIDIEWTDNLGVDHGVYIEVGEIKIHWKEPLNSMASDKKNLTWSLANGNFSLPITRWTEKEDNFKVFMEQVHRGNVSDITTPINITLFNDSETPTEVGSLEFDLGKFEKWITDSHDISVTWPHDRETVHVDMLTHTLTIEDLIVQFNYYPATDTNETIVTLKLKLSVDYEEHLGGRYEWVVVAKHSTADTAAAIMVAEILKNKQLEIGVSGLDMLHDPGPKMPYVMAKFGPTNTLADYYIPGTRPSLKDDWCHHWPVSSSNIITVGGPLASLTTEYVNEFTDAFYAFNGTHRGVPKPWAHPDIKGKIFAPTIWDKTANTFAGAGWAVVAVYKDINGTVIFTVWGMTADDTYYACKWVHDNIETLQTMNPGVTSLVLKIDYTTCPYSASIVERLGTISEKYPEDP